VKRGRQNYIRVFGSGTTVHEIVRHGHETREWNVSRHIAKESLKK